MTECANFSDETWLDLVRGLVPPEQAAEMRNHLASGCSECGKKYGCWQLVLDAVEAGRYEPPPQVLRSAKAAFSLKRKSPLLPRIAEAATLVFDSFGQPLQAGVRGGTVPARHLRHEAGDFSIDLRLESDDRNSICLIGQIVSRGTGQISVAGAGVVLTNNTGDLLYQTISNTAGEFQMQSSSATGLTLYLEISNAGLFAIPLPDLTSPDRQGSL